MTQEQIKKARAIRRRRVRERQAVVFGVLVATLGAVGLWSVGVYNGALSLPMNTEFSYVEQLTDEVFDTACPLQGTKPVGAKKIKVNVLNASEKNGLATGVSRALTSRKMKVQSTGNAETQRATTAIVYGPKGLAAAYTLSAHFPMVALILDDTKENTVLDLLIGGDYSSLLDPADVPLVADEAMTPRLGCVDIWELTDTVEPPEDTTPDDDDDEEDAKQEDAADNKSENEDA